MSTLLEPGIHVELHGVDSQPDTIERRHRPIDLVGTELPQTQPYAVRKPQIADEVIPLGVGSTEVEIGVGELVHYGVALQVAIADQCAPSPGGEHRRTAEA